MEDENEENCNSPQLQDKLYASEGSKKLYFPPIDDRARTACMQRNMVSSFPRGISHR